MEAQSSLVDKATPSALAWNPWSSVTVELSKLIRACMTVNGSAWPPGNVARLSSGMETLDTPFRAMSIFLSNLNRSSPARQRLQLAISWRRFSSLVRRRLPERLAERASRAAAYSLP